MKTLIKLAIGFLLGYWMSHVSREEFLFSMGTLFDRVGGWMYSLFN